MKIATRRGSVRHADYHRRPGSGQDTSSRCTRVDDAGQVVARKRLRRPEVLSFFAGLSPCLIGMEACATSHYWARELTRLAIQSS